MKLTKMQAAEWGKVCSDATSALEALEAKRAEIAASLQNQFDDKSERWQESGAGEEAREFITAWEEEISVDTVTDAIENGYPNNSADL